MVPLRCYIYRRIIQLWEPFKESQLTRSLESWQNLVTKLRQLLLVSFNRHLGKFEDQVRSMREKRTEPRWSFTTYFLLHVGWNAIFWRLYWVSIGMFNILTLLWSYMYLYPKEKRKEWKWINNTHWGKHKQDQRTCARCLPKKKIWVKNL